LYVIVRAFHKTKKEWHIQKVKLQEWVATAGAIGKLENVKQMG